MVCALDCGAESRLFEVYSTALTLYLLDILQKLVSNVSGKVKALE